MRRGIKVLLTLTLGLTLGGFMNGVQNLAQAAEMNVSAAASLSNAFNELKEIFAKKNPGLKVNANYAASNPLLRQIIEGAPVDVFASADQGTMDKAAEAKMIRPESRKNFAANDLVLIVPKGAAKPKALADLSKMSRIAIGNPASVPAGRYSKAALESAGLWDKLADKYIMGASVRQVLDYVARGEVDAGMVYATDAKQLGDKVDIVLVLGGHEPVTYPAAVVVSGANPKAGQAFVDFLLTPEAQAVLAKYGFSKP